MLNPCEYHAVLYLCGSQSEKIEAFDPANGCFLPVALRSVEDSECLMFVESDQLVVLSRRYVTKWALNPTGKLVKKSSFSHNKCDLMSSIAPILDFSSGFVYFVFDGQGYCVKKDGSEAREIDK